MPGDVEVTEALGALAALGPTLRPSGYGQICAGGRHFAARAAPIHHRERGRLDRAPVEVLALLADGLTNTDIAARLTLSPKTVEHHVSAVLDKLQVATRGQAIAAAHRLNLVP